MGLPHSRVVLELVKELRGTFEPDFVIPGDGCHLLGDPEQATVPLWAFALLLLHWGQDCLQTSERGNRYEVRVPG